MRGLALSLLASFSLIAGSFNCHASAANIERSADRLCAFTLDGSIVEGDFERLSNVVSMSRLDPLDERTTSVCLKSNGGSYSEGLRIAELLYKRGLSTVVEYGSECYSACAIIFMAGVSSEREIPMRKLSVGGVLGFHAPYLNLPQASYSKEQAELASQGMRQAILALVRLSSKGTQLHGSDFIKKSLISRILENGPNEVFFIKSVYEAARWDILLYDADEYFKRPGNIDGVKNACINFHSANMDDDAPISVALSLTLERYSSKFQKDDARILVKNASTNDVVCEIYPRTLARNDRVAFFGCSHDYWSSKSFGDCSEYKTAPAIRVGSFIPDFFVYDSSLPLLKFKR